MFCAKCGSLIADADVVCPKCGVLVAGKSVAPATEQVPNHMVWAILTTLFCCLIGGIISIIYASKVITKLAQGDIAGTKSASKTALMRIIINVIALPLVGLLGIFSGAWSANWAEAKRLPKEMSKIARAELVEAITARAGRRTVAKLRRECHLRYVAGALAGGGETDLW